MKEPRVFKTSPILLVFIALLFMFFLGILLFAFGPNSVGFMIPLGLLSLFLFGAMFVTLMSKTIISDDEIAVQGLFGTKSLKWTEIGRASGRGYSMKLHSQDEDVSISISPRLPGYQEVIDFTGSKRPDLFSPREYGEMRRGLSSFIGMFFVVLLMVGISVAYIYATMESSDLSIDTYIPLLFFAGIFLVIVVSALSVPRSLTLDGDTMTLKYFLNEKIIRKDEVGFVQLNFTQSRNGRHYYIALHLTNRKMIRLTGLGVSLPIAYLVLKNWHQGMRQTQNNIAPNWSDNTWR